MACNRVAVFDALPPRPHSSPARRPSLLPSPGDSPLTSTSSVEHAQNDSGDSSWKEKGWNALRLTMVRSLPRDRAPSCIGFADRSSFANSGLWEYEHHAIRTPAKAFLDAGPSAGTPGLDLPAGVRSQLEAAGVAIEYSGGCTLEDDTLFSYRRNSHTGRFAGLAWTDGTHGTDGTDGTDGKREHGHD